MNGQQLQDLLKETHARMLALSATKGEEYTGGGEANRLQNFLSAGERLGLSPIVPLYIAMDKHWNAITTFVREAQTGSKRDLSESIESRIDDLILYAILLKGLIRELAGDHSPGKVRFPDSRFPDSRIRKADPSLTINAFADTAAEALQTLDSLVAAIDLPPGAADRIGEHLGETVAGVDIAADSETQVMTNRGFVPIMDVKAGDLVIRLDSENPNNPTTGIISDFVRGESYAPGPAMLRTNSEPNRGGRPVSAEARRAEDDGPNYERGFGAGDDPVGDSMWPRMMDIDAAIRARYISAQEVNDILGPESSPEEIGQPVTMGGGSTVFIRTPAHTHNIPIGANYLGLSTTFETVQSRVVDWASEAFPARSVNTVRLKLIQEAQELALALAIEDWEGIKDEIADVQILIHDLCALREINLPFVTLNKLMINESRSWEIDAHGLSHHVNKPNT
jgi:NTP pyrophosphatase (non-canonical NTP hydrolase)